MVAFIVSLLILHFTIGLTVPVVIGAAMGVFLYDAIVHGRF